MSIKRRRERQPERIEFARDQRQQANEFAADVWQLLRGRRLLGEKFRREYPLGPYTLDFVCLDLKLDIEIDGKDHLTDEGRNRDAQRDEYLNSLGFEVMRINGFRVTQDLQSVREEIEGVVRSLRAQGPSPPAPLPEAGRGEPEQEEAFSIDRGRGEPEQEEASSVDRGRGEPEQGKLLPSTEGEGSQSKRKLLPSTKRDGSQDQRGICKNE